MKWVNIDSLAPNVLMKQQLMSLNYDLVKPEYTYGDSRIDFYMESNGEKFLTEVKGCTLADALHPGTGLQVKSQSEIIEKSKAAMYTAKSAVNPLLIMTICQIFDIFYISVKEFPGGSRQLCLKLQFLSRQGRILT